MQAAARAAQDTAGFRAGYARRAGIEGAMHQAASHGARRTRYRGLLRTRLSHIYMACALNLLRMQPAGPARRSTAAVPATSPASQHDPN